MWRTEYLSIGTIKTSVPFLAAPAQIPSTILAWGCDAGLIAPGAEMMGTTQIVDIVSAPFLLRLTWR